MRVLVKASVAFCYLRALALAVENAGACDASGCKAEPSPAVSLIQTKPSKHHKTSGPAGKQDHTDLAEKDDEREDTEAREASGHARKHRHAGVGKEGTGREGSRHHVVSSRDAMNSTKSTNAETRQHTSLGKEGTREVSKAKASGRIAMKAAEAVQDEAVTPSCTVELFRSGVVDCKGVPEAVYTTTSIEGEKFTPQDNDWASALVGPDCVAVEFEDDDYSGSQQNVQVDGKAGCVRFSYDLDNDMSGVKEVAPPVCTVDLFRAADCAGLKGVTYSSSKNGGEEFTPSDNDWMSAKVSGECQSVELIDDDNSSSQQNVQVPEGAGCVKFEWDLQNDMSGVKVKAVKIIPR